MAIWWLVLRVLFSLIPAIIRAAREGQIKSAARADVLKGLQKRIDSAKDAKGNTNETLDPNNRDVSK